MWYFLHILHSTAWKLGHLLLCLPARKSTDKKQDYPPTENDSNGSLLFPSFTATLSPICVSQQSKATVLVDRLRAQHH